MNEVSVFDWVNPLELETVKADALAMVNDPQLGRPAVFKSQVQGTTFNPATGAYTSTYTETSLNVLRGELSIAEVKNSAGLYQPGDVRFTIAQQSLTQDPGREDRLVLDGETFEVLTSREDPLSAVWTLVGRKVQ